MKTKLITLIVLSLLFTVDAIAIPVLHIRKKGGFFGHYREVTWDLTPAPGNAGYGWTGSCIGLGTNRCNPGALVSNNNGNNNGNTSAEADAIDMRIGLELYEYADRAISGEISVPKGQSTLRYQVEGEPFQRVYLLKWSQQGNSDNYDIIVTRENL